MSVRTDRVNLIVNVSGDAAKKQMNDLTTRAADLRSEMKRLKKGTVAYKDAAMELSAVKGQMDALRKTMNVTALSQKELTAELRKLKALKGFLKPQTKEFNELDKQIKKVESRLKQVRTGTFGFKSAMAGLSKEIKQFGVLAASYLGFEFISGQFRQIIRGTAQLSDQLSDIRKTANLSETEVKALNTELSKLGTRTSTKDLREIVKVLGQMGFAKEDLLGSAAAIDKIVVALGDEFGGGAEQITNVLGKLRNSLTDLKTGNAEADLLAIGNALNVLGSEGIATAPVVSDMAQRLSGAGGALGLTSGQILGLSAAMEEMGISAEVGGTAVIKILNKIAKDPAQFASVAGQSIREFTSLVNTDISQALLLVAQGFNNSKGNVTEFADKLGDAEITGARVLEVMAKLGNNTELAGQKIGVATDALQGQQSIMDEFAIKNENFAATLDKLSKEFNKLVFSPAVQNFLISAVEGALKFVQGLKEIPQWIERNRTTLIILTGATLQYLAAKNAVWLAERRLLVQMAAGEAVRKARILLTNLGTVATRAYGIAKAVLTGKVKLATIAMRLFNKVSKANPLGLIIVALTAAAAAWSTFARKTSDAAKELSSFNKALEETTKQASKEITTLNELYNAAVNVKNSTEDRNEAVKKLQQLYPAYFANLDAETIKNNQAANAYYAVRDAIIAKSRALAGQKVLDERNAQRVNEEAQALQALDDLETKRNEQLAFRDRQGDIRAQALQAEIDGIQQAIDLKRNGYLQEDKALLGIIQKAQKRAALLNEGSGTTTTAISTGGASSSSNASSATTSKKTPGEEKLDREAKALEQFRKKVAQLNQQGEAAALNRDQKEILAVTAKYEKLLKEAEAFSTKLIAHELAQLSSAERKELEALSIKHAKRNQKEIEKARAAVIKQAQQDAANAAQEVEKAQAAQAANRRAKAQTEVLNTTPGTNDNRTAKRKLATENFLLDTELLDENSEAFKLRYAQHKEELIQIDLDYFNAVMQEVDQWQSYMNDVFTSLVKIAENKDARELASFEKSIERQKQAEEDKLNSKLQSRKKYDEKIEALDAALAQKQLDTQIKAAKRQQRIGIFNATIDTAQAVARALSEYQYPYSLIIGALAAASGVAQIAAIKSEPLPVGRKGLVLNGPSHEQGGINMVDNRTGRPIAEVEGGEAVMVFSKDTYANNQPVLDELMRVSNYEGGRSIDWLNKRPTINIDRAIPAMAKGGYVAQPQLQNSATNQTTLASNQQVAELLTTLIEEQRTGNATMSKIPTSLKAHVVHRDIMQKDKEYKQAKKEVGL